MKLAISGKGGVGKSTVASYLIKALMDKGREVLAIDADPSPHLARLLGFDQEGVTPIAEMKDLLQERSERQGPFYNLNPKVDDLPDKFMLSRNGLKLMVLGAVRQGGAGCACADNAVLRNLLNRLLLEKNQDIVLDMEAGVEHLGRGTIQCVDHLLIVVQPYKGSMETAEKIKDLANDLKIRSVGLVINGCRDDEDKEFVSQSLKMEPVGIFPYSIKTAKAERKGFIIYEADPQMSDAAKKLIEKLETMVK